MPDPHSPVDSALLARCHANTIHSYRAFVPPDDPSAYEESPDLVLVSTRSEDSMGNPAFARTPSRSPTETVARVRRFFARHHLPWFLIALPEATATLRDAAAAAGLRDEGAFPGMLRASRPPVGMPPPSHVRVSLVDSLAELAAWERTFARAYGIPEFPVEERSLHLEGIVPFLAYLDGVPVATAMLVAHGGIAGVAGVGTLPEARRRGMAEAVVRRTVAEGFERGCDSSYLWATPRGVPVYEKIGFRRILDYHIWTENGAPLPADIRP